MFKKVTLATLFCVVALCGSVMAAEDGFVSLFNGKDIDGWVVRGGNAEFSIEDGCICGTAVPRDGINTFLCTKKEYANFILKAEFKFFSYRNSGIQIRSRYTQEDENSPQITTGYQFELAEDPALGNIWEERGRGWIGKQDAERSKAAFATYKKGDWNEIEVRCEGNSIRTWVNGKPVADITDDKAASGYIGLQVHAGWDGGAKIGWRNIRIKELPATK